MNKSSILSKAGNESLSNSTISPITNQKNTQKQSQNPLSYVKSSIADNLLQQMDDDYPQIQNYETQYLNESGQYVDESGKHLEQSRNSQPQTLSPSKAQSQNEFLPQKSKFSKQPLTHQPILQEPHYAQDEQVESPINGQSQSPINGQSQSPIKELRKPSSKQQNSSNIFLQQQSTHKPAGTLLKNYSKAINKYQKQLNLISDKKRKAKKLDEKPTYLTNSRGLGQEDFYKVDYSNTGKYNKFNQSALNNNSHHYQGSPALFNTRSNDLQGIQDILSDIVTLNESSSNSKYTSTKVFSKGSIDLIGTSSIGKYKGNKNFTSFGSSSRKLSSSLRDKDNSYSVTNKLDDLLTNYRLSDSITMGSSTVFAASNSQLRQDSSHSQFGQDLSHSSYNNEGSLANSSGISQHTRLNDKNARELRKMQREQKRKSNKYYEEVKNEIKYGIDEAEQHQAQNDNNQVNGRQQLEQMNGDMKKKSIEVDLNQKLATNINKNKTTTTEERAQVLDQQTMELSRKLRLYHINWNQIPLIPCQSHQSLYQFKSYPNFTSDQTQLLISVFNKLYTSKIKTYSIFSNSLMQQNSNQLVGLKQISVKSSDKTRPSSKSYKLLNKKQFIQTWNNFYEQPNKQTIKNSKQTQGNTVTLTQQQIQILIEFDLKWYTAFVKFVYQKDLSTLTDSYKNKQQQNYQSIVSTQKYRQALKLIQDYSKTQQLSLRQAITINKLKLLKHIFSSLKQTLSDQYSFGIIPSILTLNRSQKQQKLIKQFLKDNFRGGIYFTDMDNFKNICILELNRNPNIQIDQLSNHEAKQVCINQKIKLNLYNHQNQKIDQTKSHSAFMQIDIMVTTSTEEDQPNYQQEEQQQLQLHCHFNSIPYEVQPQNITQSILHFCKKYQLLVNP